MARTREIRLCREGFYFTAIFLIVLIGAVSRQLNLLMLIGSILAGPVLFSLLYGRLSLSRLIVDRKLPTHLYAGERLKVDVTLCNQRRLFGLWAIRVEDSLASEHAGTSEAAKVGVFFPRVAAGETRQVSYEGRLPRRGLYRFGPLRASTRFPLGLFRHSLVIDSHDKLLVHPKLGRLSPGWAKMLREHEAGSQRMTRRGILEADFHGLREWRAGDSRRWIHWRTSARRGSLMVRQFEQRRSQNLAILVDLWQPADPSDEQLANVEMAVSFVATLIGEACRKLGAQLTLEMAAAEPIHRSGPATPLFFREQMDVMALVQPHHQDAFPGALGHALAIVPASTPTFLISTRPLDWDALRKAAGQRDAQLSGRELQAIDVASDELQHLFQA